MGCSNQLPLILPSADVVHPQVKVVRSGNLITGQNPASARPLAEEILKALEAGA
jgi:putative intracellular protease/amidase